MSWLPESYGKTPAEIQAGYQVHVGGMPNISPQRNQLLDVISKISPEVTKYIRKKQSDEIANQLLKLSNAPPEVQGTGLSGYQMYRQYQNDQPDTAMDDLNYQIKYRQAHPEEYPDTGRHGRNGSSAATELVPVVVDGQTYMVTPAQALVQKRSVAKRHQDKDPESVLNKDLQKEFGIDTQDLMDAGENAGITQGPTYARDRKLNFQPPGRTAVTVDENKLMPYVNRATDLKKARAGGSAQQNQGATSGGQGGYIPGRTYAGKQYVGGDPNDPNNWR